MNDRHGAGSPWSTANLAPPQLAAFYRWLVYIPANIYPTITIVEFPERYIAVPDGAPVTKDVAKEWVAAEGSERRKDVWKLLEAGIGRGVDGCKSEFALGTEKPTMIDVYVTLMAHWTPYPR